MAKRGKKYLEAAKLIDRSKAYQYEEALSLVGKTSTTKFDASVYEPSIFSQMECSSRISSR